MTKIKVWDSGVGSVDQFYSGAKDLRNEFEERFSDPLRKPQGRFVWDAWNVPSQYSHLRSPLNSLFSEDAISGFLDQLSAWSQEHLGLSAISYPWASAYLDNHYQALHTDANHGPWAFVYSLTPQQFSKKYTGGETRIVRPDAFRSYSIQNIDKPQEEKDFWIDIAPDFNRLTFFDPRRAHCVRAVSGPQDIREARLVIHGWFSDPRPFYTGKIKEPQAASLIKFLSESASQLLAKRNWCGLLPLRMDSSFKVTILHDQLVDLGNENAVSTATKRSFIKELQALIDQRSPKLTPPQNTKDKFSITLPLDITL